jgi:hypothetical protein
VRAADRVGREFLKGVHDRRLEPTQRL